MRTKKTVQKINDTHILFWDEDGYCQVRPVANLKLTEGAHGVRGTYHVGGNHVKKATFDAVVAALAATSLAPCSEGECVVGMTYDAKPGSDRMYMVEEARGRDWCDAHEFTYCPNCGRKLK